MPKNPTSPTSAPPVDQPPITFGDKLKQMRLDLARIVNAMNLDRSEEIALSAQEALMHVDKLETKMRDMVDWDWAREDVEWNPDE